MGSAFSYKHESGTARAKFNMVIFNFELDLLRLALKLLELNWNCIFAKSQTSVAICILIFIKCAVIK